MKARYLVPEAVFLSGLYSCRMKKKPFQEWSPTIGESMAESSHFVSADLLMRRIALAVAWVCHRVPWQSMCMVQALTAKKMLNRRGYPCTLYMGVKRDANGKMIAHAWLRCGVFFITGGTGEGYTVTGKFGDTWEK